MATLTAPEPSAAASARAGEADVAFFGHPRGLSTLFFTEMWERFSYYGMRAILILFMTAAIAQGGLGFDTGKAGIIYGAYTSMVYLSTVPGGWLADKFVGLRRAVLYGGVVIMLGHISLAIPSLPTFYLGLCLVVIGTGLLKPNISAMVGELYSEEDTRRDAAFSIYYMGINLGAFFSPLVCSFLAQSETWRGVLRGIGIAPELSWHWGFAAAAVGMFCGLVQYLFGWKHLGLAGLNPATPVSPRAAVRQRRMLQGGLGLVAGVVLLLYLLSRSGAINVTAEGVSGAFGYILALTPVVLFPSMYFFGGFDRQEKRQLIVVMVLFFGASVFWSVFEQAGSTLNLFADRSTDLTITPVFAGVLSLVLLVPAGLALRWFRRLPHKTALGAAFATLVTVLAAAGILYLFSHLGAGFTSGSFQSANALFIVVLAPVFATLWTALGDRAPSSPAKFTVGLFFVALGFAILIVAARLSANGVRVSPLWLTATYLIHTIGELCLSPVGLSAMTRLAPRRIVGLVLGIWFLAASLGNFMAGFAASFYERMPLANLFAVVTGVALVATLVMAASVGPIKRMLGRA